MAAIEQVKADSNWLQASNTVNSNFQKINIDLEKVKNATTKNKGYFATESELKSKVPNAFAGDIAYVGSKYPYQIWKWNGSTWVNSGQTGGDENVALGDYYTKTDIDSQQTEQNTLIDNALVEYNVSKFHPTSGVNGSNKYTLETAIAQVPSKYRSVGIKCSFVNEAGKPECWKYQGGSWDMGNFVKEADGGNKILEWKGDAATTRKQVAVSERKDGMQISYKNADGDWINEQYIGETIENASWEKDGNWITFKYTDIINSITYENILKNQTMTGYPIQENCQILIIVKNTGSKVSTIFFSAKNGTQIIETLNDIGYVGIDVSETKTFETILPATTNGLSIGETQSVNNTYTVTVLSKNSMQYEVMQNKAKTEQHDKDINDIRESSNKALAGLNKLTESFNNINPEELLIGQSVNPNTGGLAASSTRMAYILKLDSPALTSDTITTNAFGCALMKEGKWLAKIDPIGGAVPKNLAEGADEIRLYFLNQNTTDKFLYLNSEVNKYIPYGNTLTDYKIETNTENISKNAEDIEELKKSSGGKGGSHPMNGLEFTTVGDSLCATEQWQAKLAELAGATYLGGFNRGGTTTYGYKEDCGQRRLIKLFSQHPNVPYIFLENINDFAKSMEDSNKNLGDFNTDIPFMYETHSIDENIQNSYEEAIAYWDSNFDTFASSASPQTGYIRVLKYKKAAFQLNVQGQATSNGTFNIVIGEDSYGIAVTTEMTIDDICDAILNYSFTGFTDTAVGSTGNYTGVKLTGDNTVSAETVVSIEENGTGINIQVANVASEAEILYYFNSLNVGHFTDKSKWKTEQEMSLSSFYMGILQYAVIKFPTAKIYWMIMPRFGINFNSLAQYYKWENGVINTARYKNTGLEVAIKKLNDFQKKICDWYLLPYLDVERFCGINYYNVQTFYPNGDVHPREAGYNRWGETMYRLTISR